ncbi:MAG: BlaI/MecI/CopY family transcriptional regulator [Verrucomicrobiota bacterium]
MKNALRFSDAEWRVLKLLWQRAPQTSQELCEQLEPETNWKPSTVKTLLSRLVAKGAVQTEAHGRAYLFTAVVSEAESQRAEAQSFLERVFSGGVSPLMAHFVESHDLTDEQIREIEALLKKTKRKDRK